MEPRLLAPVFVAVQFILVKKRIGHKYRKLSVTDGGCKHDTVHRGTFPAFVHSSTPCHTYANFFLRGLSHQGSRILTIQRYVFALWKKSFVVIAVCIHRPFTHYSDAWHLDTTLDIDDEYATVRNCRYPSAHSRSRSVFGCFNEQACPAGPMGPQPFED